MTTILGSSVISICLFILVGILVGHLLWYRDNSEDVERIEDLETRYEKARAAVANRKAEVQSLNERVEELEQLAQRYQNDVITFKQADADSRIRFDEEHRRSESLKQQLQQALRTHSIEQKESREQHEALAEINRHLQREMTGLRDAVESESKIDLPFVDQLQERFEAAAMERDEAKHELARTVEDLTQRCKDLDVLRDEHDVLARELEQTVQRATQLEAELSQAAETQVEQHSLDRELELAGETLSQQQQMIDDREHELEQTASALTDYKIRVDQAHDHQLKLEEMIAALQHRVSQRDEAVLQLQGEVDSARSEVEAARSEAESAKAEAESARSEVVSARSDAETAMAEIESARTEVETVRQENAQASTMTATKDAEIGELRELVDSLVPLRAELVDSHLEVAQLRIDNERHLERIDHLKYRLDEVENEGEKNNETVDQQLEAIHRLTTEIQQHRETIETLERQVADQDSTLSQQRAVVEQRDRSIADRQNQLQQQHETIQSQQAVIAQYESDLTQLRQDSANHTNQAEQLRQELDACGAARRGLTNEVETLRTALQSHETLQTEHSETTERLSEATSLCVQLRGRLEDADEELALLQQQNQQHVSLIDDQSKQINNLTSDLRLFEAAKLELETSTQQLNEARAESDDLRDSIRQLEMSMTSLQDQSEGHSTTIQQLRGELENKDRRYREAVERHGRTEQKLQQQSAKVDDLTKQLANVEGTGAQLESHRKQLAELKQHLQRVAAEHQGSLTENEKAQSRIRELEGELHRQADEIRELRRRCGSIDGLDDEDDRQAA